MMLPWMAAKILLRPVAELRPHAGNARVHSAEQLEQIKASMLAFGFTNPLLVDEDGVLIAGHGRLEAASALGMAKVSIGTQTGPPIGVQKGPPFGARERAWVGCCGAVGAAAANPGAVAPSVVDQARFLNRQLSLPVSTMSQ